MSINPHTRLLMCRPAYFASSDGQISYSINPYMAAGSMVDIKLLNEQHEALAQAHKSLGREIEYLAPVPNLPDLVYTANLALIIGHRAMLGRPRPAERRPEIPHAKKALEAVGFQTHDAPYDFSGQGDALVVSDDLILMGDSWRTDPRMADVLSEFAGRQVVPISTIPDPLNPGNSRFYDLDIAIAVLAPGLIAYALDALTLESQAKLLAIDNLLAIPVPLEEALTGALNLISDGQNVMMPKVHAPNFRHQLAARNFNVQDFDVSQLWLGGGGVRCTALSLNQK